MAENSFVFYKNNSGDVDAGAQKAHSSFSTDVLSTGGTYCRDYTANSSVTKAFLTGSDFQGLDGTQAVSLRAKVRTSTSSTYVLLLAKSDAANPPAYTQWYNIKGYMYGIRYYGTFHGYNGTTYYDNDSNGVTVTGMNTNYTNQWVHVRMDVEPVISGGSITGDKIKAYTSSDNGSTWTLKETYDIASTDSGFIPWSDATYNRYGFAIYDGYIDDFEIYISTGYA